MLSCFSYAWNPYILKHSTEIEYLMFKRWLDLFNMTLKNKHAVNYMKLSDLRKISKVIRISKKLHLEDCRILPMAYYYWQEAPGCLLALVKYR